MLGALLTILKIIFILGFLIFIHEGGHFIVAKLCKIRVNEFAIGFGPVIFKKQGKETLFQLRLIPLGGFCNMEGEEERSEVEGSFSKASIPKRIAVVAAGGLVNIIFALLIYFTLMSCVGNNVSNVIDTVVPNYSAQTAGLQENDKILKIDGKKIKNKADLDEALEQSNGNELSILIERDGKEQELKIKPTEEKYNYTGIAVNTSNDKLTEIAALYPNSPGEKQGLQAKDIIIAINDNPVENNAQKLVDYINLSIGEEIKFTVERNGENLDITIMPDVMSNYLLGVNLKMAENNFINNIYYAFFDTGEFAISIVDNLRLLFSGGVSIDQLMGPVGISDVVAQTNGLADFIYILALISISLGFTNLLPFPPLDGGKIVILLIEAIRRKPLKEKTEINIQLVGFIFLMALMVYVTYNDILRIF
ncbi:MAG: RIP metalloprotease RseP [Clostridia bacterium]|nr:RIP metalloprotease RseP [Clostridia bacterium]